MRRLSRIDRAALASLVVGLPFAQQRSLPSPSLVDDLGVDDVVVGAGVAGRRAAVGRPPRRWPAWAAYIAWPIFWLTVASVSAAA